jgi:hypothetical protein
MAPRRAPGSGTGAHKAHQRLPGRGRAIQRDDAATPRQAARWTAQSATSSFNMIARALARLMPTLLVPRRQVWSVLLDDTLQARPHDRRPVIHSASPQLWVGVAGRPASALPVEQPPQPNVAHLLAGWRAHCVAGHVAPRRLRVRCSRLRPTRRGAAACSPRFWTPASWQHYMGAPATREASMPLTSGAMLQSVREKP